MLGLASEPAILLAERLMQIVPPGLTKIFYSDSGATATEVAFKLAAQYWHNLGRAEKMRIRRLCRGVSRRHRRGDVGRPDAGVPSSLFSDAVQGAFRAVADVTCDPSSCEARCLRSRASRRQNRRGLHRADRAGRRAGSSCIRRDFLRGVREALRSIRRSADRR